MTPAVFLDRDGTMIVDKGYLDDPEEIEFPENALDGLRALGSLGLPLVCVSNQSGVGRGYFTEAQVDAVNARLALMLADQGIPVAGWYYCTHLPESDCTCRKPRAGLAHQAGGRLGLDLAASFVIGDKPSDMGFAEAIGATGILVGGRASGQAARRVPDLLAAALEITGALAARGSHDAL